MSLGKEVERLHEARLLPEQVIQDYSIGGVRWQSPSHTQSAELCPRTWKEGTKEIREPRQMVFKTSPWKWEWHQQPEERLTDLCLPEMLGRIRKSM